MKDMSSSDVYEFVVSVGSLRQKLEAAWGIWDPVEREYGMTDDGSISTRMWNILNRTHCEIMDLMDEVSRKEV
jgi:hypothetical protein